MNLLNEDVLINYKKYTYKDNIIYKKKDIVLYKNYKIINTSVFYSKQNYHEHHYQISFLNHIFNKQFTTFVDAKNAIDIWFDIFIKKYNLIKHYYYEINTNNEPYFKFIKTKFYSKNIYRSKLYIYSLYKHYNNDIDALYYISGILRLTLENKTC